MRRADSPYPWWWAWRSPRSAACCSPTRLDALDLGFGALTHPAFLAVVGAILLASGLTRRG